MVEWIRSPKLSIARSAVSSPAAALMSFGKTIDLHFSTPNPGDVNGYLAGINFLEIEIEMLERCIKRLLS